MKTRTFRIFVGGFGLIVATTTFASQVLFDNLSVTNQSDVSVGQGVRQAQGFLTGPSTFLERVLLSLRNDGGATAPFSVELYGGSVSNAPGGLLTALAGPVSPATGIAVYTPTNPVVLAAGKTYWVVARASGEPLYGWVLANYPPTVGDGSAASWFPADGWIGCVCTPHLLAMRVEVTQPSISLVVPGSNFQFTVSELVPGKITLIQVSPNLANWTDISTNVPATSSFVFTNSAPMGKTNNQFYRVVQLP